jgi:AAA15 family ATPase/GTPase
VSLVGYSKSNLLKALNFSKEYEPIPMAVRVSANLIKSTLRDQQLMYNSNMEGNVEMMTSQVF